MGRDENLLKGRLAERISQGIRDYLAAFMAQQVNPVGNRETCEVEGLEVTYEARTLGDGTAVDIEVTDKRGESPFQMIRLTFEFIH